MLRKDIVAHKKVCPAIKIACNTAFEGQVCKYQCLKSEMAAHLVVCPYRELICQRCGGKMPAKDTSTHDCVDYLLQVVEKYKKDADVLRTEVHLAMSKLHSAKDVLFLERECKVWETHRKPVLQVCFSPDGKYLASACADGTVKICNAVSSVNYFPSFCMGGSTARNIIFSPNGKYVVAAENSMIRIWRAGGDWGHIINLEEHFSNVNGLAFSPDGRYLFSSDFNLRMWDTKTWRCINVLRNYIHPIVALACSPDGRFLFSAGKEGFVRVQTISPWEECRDAKLQVGDVNCLAVSPDGKYILAGLHNNTVVGWEIGSWTRIVVIDDHLGGEVSGLAFMPSSRNLVVTTKENHTVRIFEVGGNWRCLRSMVNYDCGWGFGASVSADGKHIATGSGRGKVCVLSVKFEL
jgi:WD40 repeat protein